MHARRREDRSSFLFHSSTVVGVDEFDHAVADYLGRPVAQNSRDGRTLVLNCTVGGVQGYHVRPVFDHRSEQFFALAETLFGSDTLRYRERNADHTGHGSVVLDYRNERVIVIAAVMIGNSGDLLAGKDPFEHRGAVYHLSRVFTYADTAVKVKCGTANDLARFQPGGL